ncbi:MAG: hypothetical protein AB8G05_07715 [Oligoflexales bacterium]
MLSLVPRCSLVLYLVISSLAYAKAPFDSLVIQTGRRWFFGTSSFLANEVSGTLFYEISGLPLEMGGGFSFFNIKKEGLDVLDHWVKVEGAWGYEISLEAKLCLPNAMFALPFTPYLIYAHDLFSDYEIKGRTQVGGTKSQASTNGYKFNVGVDLPMNPSLTMNVEYSVGSQSIKHKYIRSFSVEIDDNVRREGSVEGSLESQAFLIGLGIRV